MNKKILLIVVSLMIIFSLSSCKKKTNQTELTSVSKIDDVHGLAVDIQDSNRLYIPTHHGLFVLINDADLYRIGENQDDYMGFSADINDSAIFFASGHPSRGGNLGILKSSDQGKTWKIISDGLNGPVDFHSMTVNPENPQTIYGWYQNNLQRSLDGGNTWKILEFDKNAPRPIGVISLIAHPTNPNTVFATTLSPFGIIVSHDKAKTWKSLFTEQITDIYIALGIHPTNPDIMLTFSEKAGLAKSEDAGKSWKNIPEIFNNELILYIAFDKQNPDTVYSITKETSIYKSTDQGESWKTIR